MKWILLLTLSINQLIAYNSKLLNDHYNFLQPLLEKIDNQPLQNIPKKKELLSKFQFLAKVAPYSKEFHHLNYLLIQDFQYQFYALSIAKNLNQNLVEEALYELDKSQFIAILKSVKNPNFYTLYAQLYLETLGSKRLQHKDIKRIYKISTQEQEPYAQLLSYMDSVNQLNSISPTDQSNLHKKLKILLFRLPKKQQKQLLRYTALQLSPLYEKESIEFDFYRLYAESSTIKREDVLKSLNYKDAQTFKEYVKKKKRSYFEEIVFKANMKVLKRNDVAKILATLYMQENNFIEARSYLRQAPRNNLLNHYNPFNTTLASNNKVKQPRAYSMRAFAETMTRLEERLEDEPRKAKDYYLYGNGLYNKSWFGNFPLCAVFFRESNIPVDTVTPPTTNLTLAYNAYLNALEVTELSSLEFNKKEEFKAEISYQLLKIEFNQALLNHKNYPKEMRKMPRVDEEGGDKREISQLLQASRSFVEAIKDYKAEYAHTAYGERVIQNSIIFKYL